MKITHRLRCDRRGKIIAIAIIVLILDLTLSISNTVEQKRLYNSDKDEFYFKMEIFLFWMVANLGTIFIIVFLALIALVMGKKVVKFVRWLLS